MVHSKSGTPTLRSSWVGIPVGMTKVRNLEGHKMALSGFPVVSVQTGGVPGPVSRSRISAVRSRTV